MVEKEKSEMLKIDSSRSSHFFSFPFLPLQSSLTFSNMVWITNPCQALEKVTIVSVEKTSQGWECSAKSQNTFLNLDAQVQHSFLCLGFCLRAKDKLGVTRNNLLPGLFEPGGYSLRNQAKGMLEKSFWEGNEISSKYSSEISFTSFSAITFLTICQLERHCLGLNLHYKYSFGPGVFPTISWVMTKDREFLSRQQTCPSLGSRGTLGHDLHQPIQPWVVSGRENKKEESRNLWLTVDRLMKIVS